MRCSPSCWHGHERHGPTLRRTAQIQVAGFVAVATLALIAVGAHDSSGWLYRGGFLAVAVATAVLVASLVRVEGGPVRAVLSSPPLRVDRSHLVRVVSVALARDVVARSGSHRVARRRARRAPLRGDVRDRHRVVFPRRAADPLRSPARLAGTAHRGDRGHRDRGRRGRGLASDRARVTDARRRRDRVGRAADSRPSRSDDAGHDAVAAGPDRPGARPASLRVGARRRSDPGRRPRARVRRDLPSRARSRRRSRPHRHGRRFRVAVAHGGRLRPGPDIDRRLLQRVRPRLRVPARPDDRPGCDVDRAARVRAGASRTALADARRPPPTRRVVPARRRVGGVRQRVRRSPVPRGDAGVRGPVARRS